MKFFHKKHQTYFVLAKLFVTKSVSLQESLLYLLASGITTMFCEKKGRGKRILVPWFFDNKSKQKPKKITKLEYRDHDLLLTRGHWLMVY